MKFIEPTITKLKLDLEKSPTMMDILLLLGFGIIGALLVLLFL